ncbi:FAD-binding monooxygenase, partial [Verminephrobacter sp. Larva24]
QNLPLRRADGTATTLMQLLAEGTQCLGLWFAPSPEQARAALDTLAARPLRLLAVGGDGTLPTLQADATLSRHLGAGAPGSFVLVRPDAYRAAVLANATPAAIATTLRTALAREGERP